MLCEIAELESFVCNLDISDFMESVVIQKAVIMTIINIGELSKRLSDTMLEGMASVPWGKMRGLRNLAAHQYGEVKMEIVWNTIIEDIPELKSALLIQQSKISGSIDAHT